MAYNFKNLADVELLNTMPEEANIVVEVDGKTKRAPQVQIPEPVDEIALIVNSETLEEVPEGATVLAEVNGEIKRVPSDGLGGGKTLIIKSSAFDKAITGGGATTYTGVIPITYTANMTFDEAKSAFMAGELIGGFIYDTGEVLGGQTVPERSIIEVMSYDTSRYTVPCIGLVGRVSTDPIELFWTSDGLSTRAPESAVNP